MSKALSREVYSEQPPAMVFLDSAGCSPSEENGKGIQEPSMYCWRTVPPTVSEASVIGDMGAGWSGCVSGNLFGTGSLMEVNACFAASRNASNVFGAIRDEMPVEVNQASKLS